MSKKITPKDVVKMRKMKAKNPDLSTVSILKQLHLRISQPYGYNILSGKYFRNLPSFSRSRSGKLVTV